MHELIHEIRELILSARKAVVHSVDIIQVLTNFEIGRRIVEHEQQGSARAAYGKALLKDLSRQLTAEFGRGFSRTNLEYMRKFFLAYRERAPRIPRVPALSREISQTPSGILPSGKKSQMASGAFASPFKLSWSQYVFLITMNKPEERSFYEIEAAANGWTLPELKRQFNSGLYERLALSRDKDGVKNLSTQGHLVIPFRIQDDTEEARKRRCRRTIVYVEEPITQPTKVPLELRIGITRQEDLLKKPYVLEFLGLDEKTKYTESDLESAIIDKKCPPPSALYSAKRNMTPWLKSPCPRTPTSTPANTGSICPIRNCSNRSWKNEARRWRNVGIYHSK